MNTFVSKILTAYIVYAYNGNVFIPICITITNIEVLTNFTNCFDDLPVIVQYFSTNVFALLTTDLIIRRTSGFVNCNQISNRYFDLPESRVLLKQIGTKVQQIKRDDVLWIAIDTSNVMMQRTNFLS